MSTAKVVVLTILSCSSLIIALYCLIFMVPVKRFWQRIRTLGGGLKGIEAHLNGVRASISQRLEDVENNTREQLETSRRELEESLERIYRANRQTRRELEELRHTVESLQSELHGTSADSRRALQNSESLATRLQQTKDDFEALDAELRQAVRQQVANSFSSVESTVLATLEAIQQEIVYGLSDSSPSARKRPTHPPGSPRCTREKIITVEPLFANMRREEVNDQPAEDEEEPGGESADEENQD